MNFHRAILPQMSLTTPKQSQSKRIQRSSATEWVFRPTSPREVGGSLGKNISGDTPHSSKMEDWKRAQRVRRNKQRPSKTSSEAVAASSLTPGVLATPAAPGLMPMSTAQGTPYPVPEMPGGLERQKNELLE
eukprot:symbB.v1.2.024857.t2/scaffold2291.1/size145394/1